MMQRGDADPKEYKKVSRRGTEYLARHSRNRVDSA
jgi:hypothetical protein